MFVRYFSCIIRWLVGWLVGRFANVHTYNICGYIRKSLALESDFGHSSTRSTDDHPTNTRIDGQKFDIGDVDVRSSIDVDLRMSHQG